MTNSRIYFDNAATTYPKPEEVYKSHDAYFRSAANPGRGAHQQALQSARVVFQARVELAKFLGITDAGRLIFTPGCTHSVNFALKGMGLKAGEVVLTSALEHNSVMRPLAQLEHSAKIRVANLPYAKQGVVDCEDLKSYIKDLRPRLCIVAEASNVTGELINLDMVASICRAQRVPLMVDAAQSAGFSDQRIDDLGISIWCASGHKGLMGAPGAGLLYVAQGLDLEPLISGGTGSGSENLQMPSHYPDHLEAGTAPGPAIAALGAGVRWLSLLGLSEIRRHETELVERFLERSSSVAGLRVYGPRQAARTGTVCFSLSNMTPDVVADRLDVRYGLSLRAGLHCAALAHKSLGSLDTGAVRVSVSYFNAPDEIDRLVEALQQLSKS